MFLKISRSESLGCFCPEALGLFPAGATRFKTVGHSFKSSHPEASGAPSGLEEQTICSLEAFPKTPIKKPANHRLTGLYIILFYQ